MCSSLLLFSDIESVNLDADEWSSDINNVASVLKLWFRELPDPLLTFNLHQGFVDAASTLSFVLRRLVLKAGLQKSRMIDYDIFDYMKESTIFRMQIMPP